METYISTTSENVHKEWYFQTITKTEFVTSGLIPKILKVISYTE